LVRRRGKAGPTPGRYHRPRLPFPMPRQGFPAAEHRVDRRTGARAARRYSPAPPPRAAASPRNSEAAPRSSLRKVEDRRLADVFHHLHHPAIAAHLEAAGATREHRAAREIAKYLLHPLPRTEGLAAAHAVERLGLVQGHGLLRLRPEEQARHQSDRVLGASILAQAALHAVSLDEAQARRLGRIE